MARYIGEYESLYGPIRVWCNSTRDVALEFPNGRSGSVRAAVEAGWIEPEDAKEVKFWVVEKLFGGVE